MLESHKMIKALIHVIRQYDTLKFNEIQSNTFLEDSKLPKGDDSNVAYVLTSPILHKRHSHKNCILYSTWSFGQFILSHVNSVRLWRIRTMKIIPNSKEQLENVVSVHVTGSPIQYSETKISLQKLYEW